MVLSQEQMALQMSTLPEMYQDRLTPAELAAVTRYRDVGEWLLTVQTLVAALLKARAAVSTRELTVLRQHLATFRTTTDRSDWMRGQLDRLESQLNELPIAQSLTSTELAEQMSRLPERYAKRLPAPMIEWLTGLRDEKEWEDLATSMVDLLRKYRVPISSQERTDLWLILDALDLPRTELAQLTVT